MHQPEHDEVWTDTKEDAFEAIRNAVHEHQRELRRLEIRTVLATSMFDRIANARKISNRIELIDKLILLGVRG
jgi:hypothetical protein